MLVKNRKGEIKEIIYDEKQLYNYGINRIATRDYARQELLLKMKRLQPDINMINMVLDKLESQHYISDYNRAKSLLNQFSGKESIHKTMQRILKVGVSKHTIEDLLEEIKQKNKTTYNEEEQQLPVEVNNALDLLIKKFRDYDILKKDKMLRYLTNSKGFKYDVSNKALFHFANYQN